MAPPPPQPPAQAGKFKPRKPPPKKPSASSVIITPGVTASVSATPNTSGASSNRESNRESTTGSSGRGGRGGGNARGGRGRGRGGRMPIPQGRVFFTGIEAPQHQQQQSSTAMKAAAAGSKSKEGEEIIVGEISGEGVGAAAIAKAAAGTNLDGGRFYDDDRWGGPYDNEATSSTTTNLPPTAYTYISSSDDDQEDDSTKLPPPKNRYRATMPISLCPPTPAKKNNSSRNDEVDEDVLSKLDTIHKEQDPPMTSPFVEGKDGLTSSPWILFKFPTRLPRINPRCTVTTIQESYEPADAVSSSSVLDDTAQDEMMILEDDNTKAASNVSSATPYDDTLKDVTAGHYGKLQVYKSGKTVLVLGSSEQPNNVVRMLVMDGIHPTFHQQVVCIDQKEKTFIPIGEVQRTAVVIPDIDEAFVTTGTTL